MKPPVITAALRGEKWDEARSDIEARATKGVLRNLDMLGYTKVKVEGAEEPIAIKDLLDVKEPTDG